MLTKRTLLALLLTAAMPLPVFAQGAPMPEPVPIEIVELAQVSHNRVRFSFNAALADGVSVTQYAASNGEAGMPSPAFTEFSFDGYSEGDYLNQAIQPRLSIYRIEDFGDYPEYITQLDDLSAILSQRPDLNAYAIANPGVLDAKVLPFLPIVPASQAMRALPQYVEVGGVRGIRYLVYLVQAPNPILEGAVFYTFQGITDDGQYYVSVMLPVNTGVLPTEEPTAVDPNTWVAGYGDYLADFLGRITAGGGEGFNPSLETLDALVQSVNVTP